MIKLKKRDLEVLMSILQDIHNEIAMSSGGNFICVALMMNKRGSIAHRAYISKWIRNLLAGAYTLEAWLDKNRPRKGMSYSSSGMTGVTREYRLEWLEWMIETLQQEHARKHQSR
jgi:hypothetical protein